MAMAHVGSSCHSSLYLSSSLSRPCVRLFSGKSLLRPMYPPRFSPLIVSGKYQHQQLSKKNQSKKPFPSEGKSATAVSEPKSKDKSRVDNKNNNYRKDLPGRGPSQQKQQKGAIQPEVLAMPTPPAGFVLDDKGRVISMAPQNKRIMTIEDSSSGRLLECAVRRAFTSLDGRRQCFLLCPLDAPVQILRIEEDEEGMHEITDGELQDIFAAASYELAKRRLHLVLTGFCLTMRGGFCFSEDDIMDVDVETGYGEGVVGGSLNEGVEIASFEADGVDYLIYAPLDPLMFVAFKNEKTGKLVMADDDLINDKITIDTIDEEREFQAYMDEDNWSEDEDYESE